MGNVQRYKGNESIENALHYTKTCISTVVFDNTYDT